MTEVRNAANGQGLYALKTFENGDIILEEKPIFTLLSPTYDTIQTQFNNFNGKHKSNQSNFTLLSFLQHIELPSSIDPSQGGKFRGMIHAAVSFATILTSTSLDKMNTAISEIQQLYAPSTETSSISAATRDEKEVIIVAKEALRSLQNLSKVHSNLHNFVTNQPQECLHVMLVWSCNSFTDGLIYKTTSRINHDCDPNAIVQPVLSDNNMHRIVATSSIQPGEEITISYLGILTYADNRIRSSVLSATKHFVCKCNRCAKGIDLASAIPCPSCHPRIMVGKYLDEDVQYDDEKSACYVYPPKKCLVCGEILKASGSVMKMMNKVSDKVSIHLQESCANEEISREEAGRKRIIKNDMVEQFYQLSTSVLGAKHWCTNLMLLSFLDQTLNAMNSAMLLQGNSGKPPDLTEVAECIDSLERLWEYVQGLNLKAHPGHLLCLQTIGISRILLSLGDMKSKNYGLEWIRKIEEYVNRGFEMDGVIKVVKTLKNSCEEDSNKCDFESMEEDECDAKKRMKIN